MKSRLAEIHIEVHGSKYYHRDPEGEEITEQLLLDLFLENNHNYPFYVSEPDNTWRDFIIATIILLDDDGRQEAIIDEMMDRALSTISYSRMGTSVV